MQQTETVQFIRLYKYLLDVTDTVSTRTNIDLFYLFIEQQSFFCFVISILDFRIKYE